MHQNSQLFRLRASHVFFWLVALLLLFFNCMASAQTGVNNTAAIIPPTGWIDPSGGCTSSSTPTCSGNNIATATSGVWTTFGAKTANPASGTTVVSQQLLAFTLTVVVSGTQTSSPVEFLDTLGAGLRFGSVTSNTGGFVVDASGSPIRLTLPAGSAVGTHRIDYSATVTAASGTVTNSVVGGSNCTTNSPCNTVHSVGSVTVTKALVSESGSRTGIAEAGEILSYAITLTNPSALPVSGYALTDILGAGVQFLAASNGGTSSGQTTQWTGLMIPANSSLVLTEQAVVANPITAAVVRNLAKPLGSPDPVCPSSACVITPTEGAVQISKSLIAESGTQVGFAEPGETLTYRITLFNPGGSPSTIDLVDTLSSGLSFVSASNGGVTLGNTTTWMGLTVPAGGSLNLTLSATVNSPIGSQSILNQAKLLGKPDPSCPSSACVVTPTAGQVNLVKTLLSESGSQAGIAEPGEQLSYALTLTNTGGSSVSYDLSDKLGNGLSLISASHGGVFGAGVISWTGLIVPANSSLVITVVAQVDSPVPADRVTNFARPGGASPDPSCPSVWCVVTPTASSVVVSKSALPASGSTVALGQEVTYTLTAIVRGRATPQETLLTDTLGPGLSFGHVVAAGVFGVSGAGNSRTFTLPAGTRAGVYSLSYTAIVTGNNGSVSNSVLGGSNCVVGNPCGTSHFIGNISVSKVLSSENGQLPGVAEPGELLGYTLTLTNTGTGTVSGYSLADTLGKGLSYIGSAPVGSNAGATTVWSDLTIPAGGNLVITEIARVDSDLTQPMVRNLAKSSNAPDPNCPGPACVVMPTSAKLTLSKALSEESGSRPGIAEPGETLTWQITLTNSGGTAAAYDLTDVLSSGLIFIKASHGGLATGQQIRWAALIVPANGRLVLNVSAAVAVPVLTPTVSNLVKPTGTAAPDCPSSSCVVTPTAAQIIVGKALTAESGRLAGQAEANELLVYTLTIRNSGGETATRIDVIDHLGPGLTYVSSSPAGINSADLTRWSNLTVPAGASLSLTLTARVAAPINAAFVRNLVKLDGDPDPSCPGIACIDTPTAAFVAPRKQLLAEDGLREGKAEFGETLSYVVALRNAGGTDFNNFNFVENVPLGATLIGVSGASGFTGPVTGPGQLPLQVSQVPARGRTEVIVRFKVADPVPASVTDIINRIDGGDVDSSCAADCTVQIPVETPAQLNIVKTAAVREARVGDLVRYSLRISNTGRSNLVNGVLVDSPPEGFSLVAGSVQVHDDDGLFTLSNSQRPLAIQGLDIAVGHQASVSYLLRVGAGVSKGTQINRAQVRDKRDRGLSNLASAQVNIVSDPLLDETLILGTVFDDRDGDGWQDPAVLTGVRVQGGFAAQAYVAGSTEIDRGQGAFKEPAAEESLVLGIRVGRIEGRQSDADPASNHQVAIRQRLSSLDLTDGFLLTNDQGYTLRLDADGRNSVTLSGDAAKGLTAAHPVVERRVAMGEKGLLLEYLIRNEGIEERGIPGVRIASAEGLLMETDPYGRFHLVGVNGGPPDRGRNFVLKVDPSTLPPGARFTTPNPLLRRITPGLPIRFDFGVGLPVDGIGGGREEVEIALGEVLFEPGSSLLRDSFLPIVRRIAGETQRYGGGELVIVANGEGQALALARAESIQRALLSLLSSEVAKALSIVVRTELKEPGTMVVGVGLNRTLLGTVLFDTDMAVIKPGHARLLDQLAHVLNDQRHGAVVTLLGHADVRAGDAYNLALGLRRAKAVYEALSARLSPEVRSQLRVEVAGSTASSPSTSSSSH